MATPSTHLGGARSRTIVAALTLGAIALASVAHAEPAPQARTVAEVTAAADAIVAAFGRHDAKAYFARFAPEATFVFHTTPRRLESRAEYEAEWAKWEKDDGFHVRGCTSSNQRVQLLSDVAVFSHSVRTELTMNSGPSTVRERETIVFQRRAEGWIAVHEHLSPDPSAEAPAAK